MKHRTVLVALLGFLAGAALSQALNGQALAVADEQVSAALAAVAQAHARIEALEGCPTRGVVSGLWAARQGGIHHD